MDLISLLLPLSSKRGLLSDGRHLTLVISSLPEPRWQLGALTILSRMHLVPYVRESLLVQGAGELLRIPYQAITTALVFLHKAHVGLARLQEEDGFQDLPNSVRLVSACLFLASKVEEASVRTNDLLNAVLHLARHAGSSQVLAEALPALSAAARWETAEAAPAVARLEAAAAAAAGAAAPAAATAAAAGEPPPPPAAEAARTSATPAVQPTAAAPATRRLAAAGASGWQAPAGVRHQGPGAGSGGIDIGQQQSFASEMVVGDEYYALKQALILDEQLLLRVLRFDVAVDPPARHLLNYCATLGASREVARLALCLLNDALVLTDGCLDHPPPKLAAAALHLAAGLMVPLTPTATTPAGSSSGGDDDGGGHSPGGNHVCSGSGGGGAAGAPSCYWPALGLDAGEVEVAAGMLAAVLEQAERRLRSQETAFGMEGAAAKN